MQYDRNKSGNQRPLRGCSWCDTPLEKELTASEEEILFCSHRCEVEATYWLYQQLCCIEPSRPPQSGECDAF